MEERYQTPEDARDEADYLHARAQDQARSGHRELSADDLRRAEVGLERLRAEYPTQVDRWVADMAARSRIEQQLGAERLEGIRKIASQARLAVSDEIIEARRDLLATEYPTREAFVLAAQAEIARVIKQVLPSFEDDPDTQELFGGFDNYRREFWHGRREEITREMGHVLFGTGYYY